MEYFINIRDYIRDHGETFFKGALIDKNTYEVVRTGDDIITDLLRVLFENSIGINNNDATHEIEVELDKLYSLIHYYKEACNPLLSPYAHYSSFGFKLAKDIDKRREATRTLIEKQCKKIIALCKKKEYETTFGIIEVTTVEDLPKSERPSANLDTIVVDADVNSIRFATSVRVLTEPNFMFQKLFDEGVSVVKESDVEKEEEHLSAADEEYKYTIIDNCRKKAINGFINVKPEEAAKIILALDEIKALLKKYYVLERQIYADEKLKEFIDNNANLTSMKTSLKKWQNLAERNNRELQKLENQIIDIVEKYKLADYFKQFENILGEHIKERDLKVRYCYDSKTEAYRDISNGMITVNMLPVNLDYIRDVCSSLVALKPSYEDETKQVVDRANECFSKSKDVQYTT